jgi:hypothetical protein
MNRPRCCPEPRCTPLYQYPYRPERLPPGESFSCFGRMAEPVTFVYDGVEHANDLNHCDYTPLKGVIRWQETREDWEAIRLMVTEALKRLDGESPI